MPFSAGDKLGPYEILAPIGKGGMGEVYRAIDPRLGREVAIKVSTAHFDERFKREARLAALLNHPNICTIHDVGPNYLVMEVVEGPTLADRITRGPLLPEEALRIALQIADALAAAHERDIVHRDLKPANIKITPNGSVKVLDFGLARVFGSQGALAEDAPTVAASLTEAGTILGTAAYMAPEQANGKPVDQRADIWAFGVVLYEMLTGNRLFGADTFAATLAEVLSKDPDLSLVPAGTRVLLRRCLERDPLKRLRDIGDAQFLLGETATTTVVIKPSVIPWVLTGILTLALAVALVSWHASRPRDGATMRLNVDLGPEAVISRNLGAAISPDGVRLAFTIQVSDGKRQLATRVLDQPDLTVLAGTDGANDPFFSPDGQWIGFFAAGQMKKISVRGGAAVTISRTGGAFGASWGDDQNIVFAPGAFNSLMRVSSSGGTPQPITKIAEKGDGTHRWPQVLPGGKAVLYTSHKIISGFDDARIEAVVTQTGERKTILRGGYFGRYFDAGAGLPGYLIYAHEGTVFGIGFDPVALELRGTPVALIEDAATDADTGDGMFDFSGNGVFIYGSGRGPIRTWPILWLDTSGKTAPLVEPGTYYTPQFSPDGKRLALSVDHGDKGREIEVYDLARGNMTRLTSSGEVNLFPVWTPDGRFIACESSSPSGGYGIALVRSDGSGKVQRLLEHTGLMIPGSFTSDGRRLVYHETNPETGMDVWTVPVDMSDPDHVSVGKPEPFLNSAVSDWHPAFSPDKQWIAHTSTESGIAEVYVRPFPGPGGKVKISNGGGNYAIWGSNGRDLYFKDSEGRIIVVAYTVKGDTFAAEKPRVWSDTRTGSTPIGRDLTLFPDGERFAILPSRDVPRRAGSVHLTFVLNFGDDLRRKVTVGK